MPSGKMVRSMGLVLRASGAGVGVALGAAEEDGGSVRAGAMVEEVFGKDTVMMLDWTE